MEIVEIVISVVWLAILLVVGLPSLVKGMYFTIRAVGNNNASITKENRFTRFNIFNALFVPGALNEEGIKYRARACKNLLVFIGLILITAIGGFFNGTL